MFVALLNAQKTTIFKLTSSSSRYENINVFIFFFEITNINLPGNRMFRFKFTTFKLWLVPVVGGKKTVSFREKNYWTDFNGTTTVGV